MDRFPLPCKVIQSVDYLYTEKNLQKTFLSGKSTLLFRGDTWNLCLEFLLWNLYLVGYLASKNESSFTLRMMFRQTRFREVEQIRAYDFEYLVGNVGGYIGMFLGYAISNLPRFFLDIITFTKKYFYQVRI